MASCSAPPATLPVESPVTSVNAVTALPLPSATAPDPGGPAEAAAPATLLGSDCPLRSSGLIWPLCSTDAPPMSSPYGPRQKASAGYSYEFHRGLDMPVPAGSPVYAVADGVVTLDGRDPGYDSTVVQIEHSGNPRFFSNYLHVRVPALVSAGQRVHQGQLIAYSGVAESGFAHLHFEIRRGTSRQRDAVNPFLLLPHRDAGPPGLRVLGVDTSGDGGWRVAAQAGTQPRQLDLAGVGVRSPEGSAKTLDLAAVNAAWDNTISNPLQSGVCLQPARFSAESDGARVTFTFTGLPDSSGLIVQAHSTSGRASETTWRPSPTPLALTPGTQSLEVRAGTDVAFTHRLINTSGSNQVFHLEALSAQGWDYGVRPAEVHLDAGATAMVRLVVDVPSDTLSGTIDCLTLLATAGDERVARGVSLDSLSVH